MFCFITIALRPKECHHNISTYNKNLNNAAPFKNLLGINAFEWNFLQNPNNPNNGLSIYEPKMQLIKSFGGVRHYLDWQKIENVKGNYTFNPTANGGWNLDTIYQRCKNDSIDVLVCLKNCPDWLQNTYPIGSRDVENVPASFGLNKLLPKSYIDQAKAAFQFAARYGANKYVDAALVTVNEAPRWKGDKVNKVKIGTALIKFIECDNERDKWWKGEKRIRVRKNTLRIYLLFMMAIKAD